MAYVCNLKIHSNSKTVGAGRKNHRAPFTGGFHHASGSKEGKSRGGLVRAEGEVQSKSEELDPGLCENG
jgi:hypothetical protein